VPEPAEAPDQKIPLQEWAPSEVAELDLYEKREKIYTRKIEGFYQRLRQYTGWPLLLGYFCLPWLTWSDRQAVLFDLPARKFYIFGLTIWPQDLSLLALILIIAALALFLVTSVAGRVWCGYTCPQTVWTAMFMWVEQKVEGTRNQRRKLDGQPWSVHKVVKKLSKHIAWLFIAFSTGLTFVGYFTPIHDLGWLFHSLQPSSLAQHWEPLSWVVFFTLATYLNAGWMREQVCEYMCPYARFQSVMFDSDTLIVSYDPARGEPRGSRKHGEDIAEAGKGDCIDCKLCVQVCPTGIDIRDGLQFECIACALCIDACDSIMEKMSYPPGLISYTTENALLQGEKGGRWLEHVFRPKVAGYSLVLLLIVSFFLWRILSIENVELSVLRDRQVINTSSNSQLVENLYLLKVANKQDKPLSINVGVESAIPLVLMGAAQYSIGAAEVESFRVRVQANKKDMTKLVIPIVFSIDADGEQYTHESRLIGELR